METIDTMLNKAARNAIGLTPSFPTEAIHRPANEMGLGYKPMRDRATQMGIEHITQTLNKPSDRGHMAYTHTINVANTYQHWPIEAYEATQARLPTLRVLSYVRNVEGMELDNIPPLQTQNQIATSIRTASESVDQQRFTQRQQIPKNLPNK